MRLYGKDKFSDYPWDLVKAYGPGILIFTQNGLLDGWLKRGTWKWEPFTQSMPDHMKCRNKGNKGHVQWYSPIGQP